MPQISVDTPFGPLTIVAAGDAIVGLSWTAPAGAPQPGAPVDMQPAGVPPGGVQAGDIGAAILDDAAAQLTAYFGGRRRHFALPLAPAGTEFQRTVWRALEKIGFGETVTYGELARRLKSAPRAVGGACARNPIPLFIPCHRIVGAGGALGGYSGAGGIAAKRALLALEGAALR